MTKLGAFLIVLLLPALALAQTVVNTAPPALSTGASLVLLGCAALSYILRRVSPKGGFLHTPPGAFVLAGVSALIGAIASVVEVRGLDLHAIVQACIGAGMSLFATSNPSVPVGTVPPLSKPSIAAAVLPLLLLPLLVVGLAACPAPTPMPTSLDGGTVSTDGGTDLQKFDAALASCEESNNLVAASGPQAQQILQILMSGGFSGPALEQKLEAIAAIAGGSELSILGGCATFAYLQVFPIMAGVKPTPSQGAARIYQAKLRQVAPGVRFGGR